MLFNLNCWASTKACDAEDILNCSSIFSRAVLLSLFSNKLLTPGINSGILFLVLNVEARLPFNAVLIVEDIVVNQKGIGTEIMEWIENEIKNRGIKRLMADIGIKNKRAQEFMKKLGYEAQTIVYVKNIKEGAGDKTGRKG